MHIRIMKYRCITAMNTLQVYIFKSILLIEYNNQYNT